MAIFLQKEYYLDLDKESVWDAIVDPHLLSEILPNCDNLEPVSKNKYTAHINVKVGPIQSNFKSKMEMFDINAPDGYKFRVEGDSVKGTMGGVGEIKLESRDLGTRFIFSAEGNITGLIARFGQRLIEAVGKKLMDQGFENFKNKVIPNA